MVHWLSTAPAIGKGEEMKDHFDRFREGLSRLTQWGPAPGILLLSCVVVSMLVANSPLGPALEAILAKEIGIHTDSLHLRYSVSLWINDGLMAIFFLLVGLEIKRELVSGELSSPKKAALPIVAALGGVVVPALFYVMFNHGKPTAGGWAIPMATDIAFALAIITMLGRRVPLSLKVFLAALAIVDDLIAILVIAIFYSGELHYASLLYGGVVFAVMLLLNRLGTKVIAAYLIPGVVLWYFIHHSGIHATIAGVLTAFTLPMSDDEGEISPLEKLEHALVNPVNWLIMPIFAFSNTNIMFVEGMIEGLVSPMGLGVILGLMVGKPVGIFMMSWASVRLGLCSMPQGASWKHVLGVGMLAGIGFTMSIFIAMLSFSGQQLLMSEAKFAVLVASCFSALIGCSTLVMIGKKG